MGVSLSATLPTLFPIKRIFPKHNLKLTGKKEDGEVKNDHSWLEPGSEAKVRSAIRVSEDLA